MAANHWQGVAGIVLAMAAFAVASSARADLRLCNRLSYIVETAIGIEDKGATATRGWFRIDPGQCRTVLQGAVVAEHLYVNARALPVFGPSPIPQVGQADLCVAAGNFVIAGAKSCSRSGQRPARFAEIKPLQTEQGLVATLAEEAEYTDEQARLAAIQRLLIVVGYDANPIDGLTGRKTEAAIAQFLKDRNLPADTANAPNFLDLLVDAAQRPDGSGFAWCNETAMTVMAALGHDDNGAIVTRGWYRIEPGKCLRPELRGQQRRLYSYGEAVDADGQVVRRGSRPFAWGGATVLCTSDVRFETSDHKDCAGNGLTSAGFAAIDVAARGATTVRFKD
jgi:uncharacterized membrane protein